MSNASHSPPDRAGKSVISTVTLLLTDVEDSTHLWELHPEAMASASARHDRILEESIRRFNGATSRSQWEGDSVVGIFKTALQASASALDVHRLMSSEPWPHEVPIKLRFALYTGEALITGDTVSGPILSRAIALRDLAEGGQILVSQITAELLRQGSAIPGILVPWGLRKLRAEMQPEEIFQLRSSDAHGDVQIL